MKRITKISIAALAVAGIGATALATPLLADACGGGHKAGHKGGQKGGRHHGGHRMMKQLVTYDANKDGKLTQEEIDAGRLTLITKFDADGDGSLNLVEYKALWSDAKRDRMVDRFQKHDDDGDGKVTLEEFNERFSGIVKRMDRNDDGVLDKNDRRQHGDRKHRG